jgi:hypothetical protein
VCGDNRNLEEIMTHGAIGSLGINYEALNHWARQHFNLRDDSWNPWGAFDPNDKARPYGKVINAIFLIGYALTDNNDLQWHSTEDYVTLAAAGPNRFHGATYLRIITAGSGDATGHWGVLGTDHTDLHCAVFREGSASNFPSHRAGTLVHEAWHHWQYDKGFDTSHRSGGAVNPANFPSGGDYYLFHTVSVYKFGHLHQWAQNPPRFHSPYQVQAEFYADLAELSRPQIPNLITQTARARGNAFLTDAFVNPVAYRIGQPRPW